METVTISALRVAAEAVISSKRYMRVGVLNLVVVDDEIRDVDTYAATHGLAVSEVEKHVAWLDIVVIVVCCHFIVDFTENFFRCSSESQARPRRFIKFP